MNHLLKILFSNRTSALLLLVFAISMATATFIENDYSTETAKALVYNAKWFEILVLLLAINFIGNISKYNLFSLEKAPIFIFHIAFIIIILGAGVTRYRGYEALITIKEETASDRMISIDSHLQIKASNDTFDQSYISKPIHMSEIGFNNINNDYVFDNKKVNIKLQEYIPRAHYVVKDSTSGATYLHIVIADKEERKDFYVKKGDRTSIYGIPISFENENKQPEDIFITKKNDIWKASFPKETDYFSMTLNKASSYPKDSLVPLQFKALSEINKIPLVFNEVIENKYLTVESKERTADKKNPEAAIKLLITSDEKQLETTIFGGPGYMNPHQTVFINGIHLNIRYGSKPIQLPFSIYLKDFILERYPGSDSPSAFYSNLQIQEKNNMFDYTIFMNNVLNHKGFRFFQSAYLPDESGTILSVNHDYWGTLITYIGYSLLGLGMLLSLCWRTSYFGFILKLLREK